MGVASAAHPSGVHADHQAVMWLAARNQAGLDAGKLGFLLPPVGLDGFSDGPTQTYEFVIHLREILVKLAIGPVEELEAAKCTVPAALSTAPF